MSTRQPISQTLFLLGVQHSFHAIKGARGIYLKAAFNQEQFLIREIQLFA